MPGDENSPVHYITRCFQSLNNYFGLLTGVKIAGSVAYEQEKVFNRK
jgi:hypothetical protein